MGYPAMNWRDDGIRSTFSDESTQAWNLDGRIWVIAWHTAPLVAWTTFVPWLLTNDAPLLATFHVPADGLGCEFRLWRLEHDRLTGSLVAHALSRNTVQRFIPARHWPSHPQREGASELLCRLWDGIPRHGSLRVSRSAA